jgi:membrane protein
VTTAVTEERHGPRALDHLRRAVDTYRSHDMTDRAASLTYFGMLSLFPGALTIVSVLTLVHQQDLATRAADYLTGHGADRVTADAVRGALDSMINKSSGAAGVTLVIGLALSLNGASAAFGAAGRALNAVHGIDDDRGFVRRKLEDLGWTLAVVALFLFTLVAIFLGGRIADDLFGTIGLGDTGALVWSIARWPLALLSIAVAFEIVYAFAPDLQPRQRRRRLTPGSLTAGGAWLVASLAFSVYLSHFSSYGAAYGAFGAAIVLLLWIYITSNAFLFGAELDKAIERSVTAGRGGPPVVTPPPGSPTAASPRGRGAP